MPGDVIFVTPYPVGPLATVRITPTPPPHNPPSAYGRALQPVANTSDENRGVDSRKDSPPMQRKTHCRVTIDRLEGRFLFTTYYVSPSGSDAAVGTSGAA